MRMPEPGFPAIEAILPHEGAMVLLSRVLSHHDDRTVCAVDVDDSGMFRDASGAVPVWVAVEYMAQCVAAHAGLVAHAAGEPPPMGFLLGGRRVTFHVARFQRGERLRVNARRVWGGTGGMVSFACSLEDAPTGKLLAEGRLNCAVEKAGKALGEVT
jgi:predicted hotdog family 3-hydroxylacyl-ACP dehydratase